VRTIIPLLGSCHLLAVFGDGDRCRAGRTLLALLAIAPIRIAAVYHSGGRGAHAPCQIDAASKLEADDICEVYRREYVPLGACKGTLSAFRLTRLRTVSAARLPIFVLLLNGVFSP
jgi:hypothetical protein